MANIDQSFYEFDDLRSEYENTKKQYDELREDFPYALDYVKQFFKEFRMSDEQFINVCRPYANKIVSDTITNFGIEVKRYYAVDKLFYGIYELLDHNKMPHMEAFLQVEKEVKNIIQKCEEYYQFNGRVTKTDLFQLRDAVFRLETLAQFTLDTFNVMESAINEIIEKSGKTLYAKKVTAPKHRKTISKRKTTRKPTHRNNNLKSYQNAWKKMV